jgi:hypothetical protein
MNPPNVWCFSCEGHRRAMGSIIASASGQGNRKPNRPLSVPGRELDGALHRGGALPPSVLDALSSQSPKRGLYRRMACNSGHARILLEARLQSCASKGWQLECRSGVCAATQLPFFWVSGFA